MNKYTDGQRMMLFSAIAYEPKDQIQSLVHSFSNGRWEVVWGPVETLDSSNLTYIAKSKFRNEYVLATRGANKEPFSQWLDVVEDEMVDWTYIDTNNCPIFGEPRVAKSLMKDLNDVLTISDHGPNLEGFFSELQFADKISVTGHGSGGTLSPLIATWLDNLVFAKNPNLFGTIQPYSFASQQPGNHDFEIHLDMVFPNGGVWSFSNKFDVISQPYKDLLDAIDIYKSEEISCPSPLAEKVRTFYHKFSKNKAYLGSDGKQQKLNSSIMTNDYLQEVSYQHSPVTYLQLLGVSVAA